MLYNNHMTKFISCLLFSIILVTQCVVSQTAKIRVDVENVHAPHQLVDAHGRVRVFHGLNRVQKGIPWYPIDLLNATHIDYLASWGFNVVRLGMMWSGVEIAPFTVNETYITVMDTIIKSLEERGIHVILDMHQDGLSSKFNNYDGAPLWLVNSFPEAKYKYPWPFGKPPADWNLNYVTYECGEAFHSLYSGAANSLDHITFFWKTVAKRFGSYENVIGYELINEPWPGNVLADLSLFVPGKVGSEILLPFYDKITAAIAEVDNTTMIFYEPVTWGMILHDKELGSGFSRVPGGDKFRGRSVLSFHYYCWFVGTDNTQPYLWWLQTICDNIFYPDVLDAIHRDVNVTGGGYFLTEFGDCEATINKNTTEYKECLNVLQTSDERFLSWTYWDSEFFFSNGSINIETVKLFSRTYAMAIAGTPLQSSFDPTSGAYRLQYKSDPTINQPTVIFVSWLHYPNGFHVYSNVDYTIKNKYYVEVTPKSSQPTVVNVQINGEP